MPFLTFYNKPYLLPSPIYGINLTILCFRFSVKFVKLQDDMRESQECRKLREFYCSTMLFPLSPIRFSLVLICPHCQLSLTRSTYPLLYSVTSLDLSSDSLSLLFPLFPPLPPPPPPPSPPLPPFPCWFYCFTNTHMDNCL